MPAKTPANKGTSPSKNIQRGIDNAWGAQKGFDTPQAALAKQWNKKPIPVSGNSK